MQSLESMYYNDKIRYIDFTGAIADMGLTAKIYTYNNLNKLEQFINSLPSKVFANLGSGDYHYITYFLLKRLSYLKPLLVIIDNHFDMDKGLNGAITCGSWVTKVIKERLVRNVFIIGASSKYKPTSILPSFITYITESNICKEPKKMNELCGKLIYLSVDKDILDYSVLNTNWDQGKMTEKSLLKWVWWIKKRGNIIGADICGGVGNNPLLHLSNPQNEKAHRRIDSLVYKIIS